MCVCVRARVGLALWWGNSSSPRGSNFFCLLTQFFLSVCGGMEAFGSSSFCSLENSLTFVFFFSLGKKLPKIPFKEIVRVCVCEHLTKKKDMNKNSRPHFVKLLLLLLLDGSNSNNKKCRVHFPLEKEKKNNNLFSLLKNRLTSNQTSS